MAMSLPSVTSSMSSSQTSLYLDVNESFTRHNHSSKSRDTYYETGGAQRTTRTYVGAHSSSGKSTRPHSPYSERRPQRRRHEAHDINHTNSTKPILEQLRVNSETYTELQAEEALELARAARDIIFAEELYTLERHAEGIIQIQALENKVIEVKNRLRIADLQLAFVRDRMIRHGYEPGENDAKDFAERLRMKPLVHASPLTSLKVDMITSFARHFETQATETRDVDSQEPVSKPDISR